MSNENKENENFMLETFREFIDSNNISGKKVSKYTGLTYSTVASIKNGYQKLRGKYLEKLMRGYLADVENQIPYLKILIEDRKYLFDINNTKVDSNG